MPLLLLILFFGQLQSRVDSPWKTRKCMHLSPKLYEKPCYYLLTMYERKLTEGRSAWNVNILLLNLGSLLPFHALCSIQNTVYTAHVSRCLFRWKKVEMYTVCEMLRLGISSAKTASANVSKISGMFYSISCSMLLVSEWYGIRAKTFSI